jgi:membrane protein CcdC involved in cytochrome C biogenesis
VNWSKWIRQIHRWLAIAFTVTVIVTFLALQRGKAPVWVNYLALPPLFLLLFTGLYLFALPYVTQWRSGRRTD